ncbi:hypothetical protein RCL_jg1148.t1 [Rhizophagus clarus]|uniref:Uncharacterized protein n=1 Tax=Rhizophagus clarus TaxID=94130 RepID=A0A8H3KZ39_9GLOM|nr:hypothetical protein RCL_jg1148.t1 [Rhizophagus clarus]
MEVCDALSSPLFSPFLLFIGSFELWIDIGSGRSFELWITIIHIKRAINMRILKTLIVPILPDNEKTFG